MTLTHAERGRLGGLTTAHKYGAEAMRRRGAKGGQATLANNGKVHFVRMNLISNGKLPKKEAASQQK